MTNKLNSYRYVWVSTDLLILALSFVSLTWAFGNNQNTLDSLKELAFLMVLMAIWLFSTYSTKLYDEYRSRNFGFELIGIMKNVLIQTLAGVIILFFFFKGHKDLSRTFISSYSGLLFVLLFIKKFSIRKIINHYRRKGKNLRNVILIGTGEIAKKFYKDIVRFPHFGYKMVGFIDDEQNEIQDELYLGKLEILNDLLDKNDIHDVIVALPNHDYAKVEGVVETCQNHTTRVRIIPDYFKYLSKQYGLSNFGSFPIITMRNLPLDELHNKIAKRAFDLTFSIMAFFLVFIWIYPIIALIIKINSKGPILFKQERWGLNNKRIICFKFRSMTSGSSDFDKSGKFKQASKVDSRITSVGKFLRRTNLDELPQLLNVIRGEMSLVGPRPHAGAHNMELKSEIDKYLQRHLVKPGISGWAQVNGYRGEATDPDHMVKRVEFDIWYIENWTLWLDIQIIFYTVWKMIKGDKNAY